jgi:asparagine synthase (glutamine-hydrolysing)
LRIPKNLKVPDKNTTKYILKKAVESILPKDIIYRKKQGFWAPVNEWFRNEWLDYTRSKILGSPLMVSGIFNFDYVKDLIESHGAGKSNNGLRIYNLLQLAIWHERFIE